MKLPTLFSSIEIFGLTAKGRSLDSDLRPYAMLSFVLYLGVTFEPLIGF